MCPPHVVGRGFMPWPCQDGVVVSVSASCGRSWVHALVSQDGVVVSVSASCGRSWVHAPAMSGWLSSG